MYPTVKSRTSNPIGYKLLLPTIIALFSAGFLCPVHTPDGAPCGLLNHLTALCQVLVHLMIVNTSCSWTSITLHLAAPKTSSDVRTKCTTLSKTPNSTIQWFIFGVHEMESNVLWLGVVLFHLPEKHSLPLTWLGKWLPNCTNVQTWARSLTVLSAGHNLNTEHEPSAQAAVQSWYDPHWCSPATLCSVLHPCGAGRPSPGRSGCRVCTRTGCETSHPQGSWTRQGAQEASGTVHAIL